MDLESQLAAKLQEAGPSEILVLGIGNSLKADDGIGPFVCEALKPQFAGQVMDAATTPENYIQKILDFSPRFLLIVDAMDFGGKAGQIRLLDSDKIGSAISSTHALDPQIFMGLIQKQCDAQIVYLGIQPGDLTLGNPMTEAMQTAAEECVRVLTAVLKEN